MQSPEMASVVPVWFQEGIGAEAHFPPGSYNAMQYFARS